MDLQRFGFKFFVEESTAVQLAEFIPIFHRWIQTHVLEGLLIDVADYAHVQGGPGIMLIAHEGNYAVDLGHDRMGLLYYRKQAMDVPLAERLSSICRTTLRACRELEQAPELTGRVRFRGDELVFVANDRLLAPNTEETAAALRPALSALLARLYPGADCMVARQPDPRERFTLSIRAPQPVAVATLLERVSG